MKGLRTALKLKIPWKRTLAQFMLMIFHPVPPPSLGDSVEGIKSMRRGKIVGEGENGVKSNGGGPFKHSLKQDWGRKYSWKATAINRCPLRGGHVFRYLFSYVYRVSGPFLLIE